VEDKLRAGAKVADIGCGLGASTILLAPFNLVYEVRP
jgi:cyclopropane fatty-acyl-phospholipid synthase-like methyltransferase